jgi:glycosyltransferase involved in cell wall biosynthesis
MINSSIIIPFKNSEKSIIKTLKSITMQNVNSDLYEVLLINDFSNDKSMHTIKKYINNLKNFKLYKSKKNIVGPGHARNVGISYSSGRYILFLDSDDCLKKGCLNKIINKTNIIKCDVYAFGFNIVDTLSNMKRKKGMILT